MIISPESNIPLTPEHDAEIAEAKKILNNIESEVSIATKNLRVIKQDWEKLTKDRIYQEELLEDLGGKVEAHKDILGSLNLSISESQIELSKTIEKNELLKKELSLMEDDIKVRKENLEKAEKELEKKVQEVSLQVSELNSDKLLIKKSKDAFTEALKTVTWN